LDPFDFLIFAFEASFSAPKRDVRLAAVQTARTVLVLSECQGGLPGRAGSYQDLNNFLDFLLKALPSQAAAAQLLTWKHWPLRLHVVLRAEGALFGTIIANWGLSMFSSSSHWTSRPRRYRRRGQQPPEGQG
jgi:hypothetical protein